MQHKRWSFVRLAAASSLLACAAFPAHAGATGPVGIEIGSVYAAPGALAEVDVRLRSDGRRLGTLRHALSRPATLVFDTAAGTPDCTPGAAAASASFAFTPAGCAGDACVGIEARLTFSGETPDDGLGYRCRLRLPAQDVGTCEHALGCADGDATLVDGTPLGLSCADGAVLWADYASGERPVSIAVAPRRLRVGEVLAINVDAGEGFAGRYSVLGADDLLAGELVKPPVGSGETGFILAAVCDGATEVRVSLYDEIAAACPGREYFVFQTHVSETVPVTVLPGPACAGDCSRDGTVSVDELITAVGIALGGESLLACPSAASSCSADIGVADLVSAVNAGLVGCPAE